MDGPLKHLENKWFFSQKAKESEIDFYINFELKNEILNILMSKFFYTGLKRIANAFEKRAIKLFNNS
jgi:coenzyme Q-binding protein COQ10